MGWLLLYAVVGLTVGLVWARKEVRSPLQRSHPEPPLMCVVCGLIFWPFIFAFWGGDKLNDTLKRVLR